MAEPFSEIANKLRRARGRAYMMFPMSTLAGYMKK
jgi:hypothetical protein